MKWVHPLKGRTIKDALATALSEVTGNDISESDFLQNHPYEIRYDGVVSWAAFHRDYGNYHSWDCMRDCLKFGFDICDDLCVVARDNQWRLEEEKHDSISN